MHPNMDRIRRLVNQSRSLQHKRTIKETTTWSKVINQEEALLILRTHKKSFPLLNCLCLKSSIEEFVEQCINVLDCLTIGARKQSKGVSGYLISTRWHKNFWLLA